jgi:hypothetical protein
MLEKRKLSTAAELIRAHISIGGIDQYCSETGICSEDFVALEPSAFDGEIYAVDGSNVVVCDWSVANLNRISAGYAVYKGRDWQRTVITYDDIFLADPKSYAPQFESYLKGIFGIESFDLADNELERLSSYFRELQEYVALREAIDEAHPGDLVLYDGGFTWKERPFGKVLEQIFQAAERKGVDLLGISKSSAFYWGQEISRPFLQHTSYAGSLLAPGLPWFLSLKGKNVNPKSAGWNGEIYIVRFDGRSERAFRVDVPSYLMKSVGTALAKAAGNSCSAECLGYPHALFRAHRDIRIDSREMDFLWHDLLDALADKGFNELQLRMLMQDFHEVLEMKPRF